MSDEAVARIYAEALFQASRDAGRVDQVLEDIRGLTALLAESMDFRRLLEAPAVPSPEKKRILQELFAKDLAPETMNFLKVLVDKGRSGILAAVLRDLIRLVDEFHNRVVAHVVTAVQPSAAIETRLRERLARQLGKEVTLDISVDPGVFGGLMVRVGDTVLDGTIRNQLARLKDKMVMAVPGGKS